MIKSIGYDISGSLPPANEKILHLTNYLFNLQAAFLATCPSVNSEYSKKRIPNSTAHRRAHNFGQLGPKYVYLSGLSYSC